MGFPITLPPQHRIIVFILDINVQCLATSMFLKRTQPHDSVYMAQLIGHSTTNKTTGVTLPPTPYLLKLSFDMLIPPG